MATPTRVTRELLTGAIKMVNSAGLRPRRDHLRKFLLDQGVSEKDADKSLSDLGSYPDWASHTELDAPADDAGG